MDIENLPGADAGTSCPMMEQGADDRAVARGALIDGLVDRWVMDRIHNSPVALVTAAYNHLIAALDDLKQRLQKEC